MLLVNISSRAWALPILAKLHDGVAGRQAPLLDATGAGRTAFAQSLDHLITLGLVERNPGHGHPLRPEFRLTAAGTRAAALASRICHSLPPDEQALCRKSWTIPVVTSLYSPKHFVDVKRSLSPITDRALSQSLKLLEKHHWVKRSVSLDSRPPRAVYSAVNAGARISQITGPEIRF